MSSASHRSRRSRRCTRSGQAPEVGPARHTWLVPPAIFALLLLTTFVAPIRSNASQDLGARFVEVSSEAGIDFRHVNGASPEKLLVETFGSGVAWIDYDNDGLLDLYFVNGANLVAGKPSSGNVLYRNTGQGIFADVTPEAGVVGSGFGTGVAVGDFDNDGLLDLYVAAYGPNLLYRNSGDGTFTDVTSKAGVAGGRDRWSSSAGFFDYDRDGDLDLYVVNYLEYELDDNPYCGFKRDGYRMYCHPSAFDGSADVLFRNNGDGTFTDVSSAAGVNNPAGKGLGVTFSDFDQDGYTDIYVANDTVRNFLYRNNGDGTFTDVTYGAGVGYDPNGKPQAGMGTDAGDFDGDGLSDLIVTNFSEELNALYRNRGAMVFEDLSESAGLGSSFIPLGFGTKFFDYDNDADLDLYVTNGHVIDNVQLYNPGLSYRQKDLLYDNRSGRFFDISSRAGPAFQIEHVGRGAAVADYDNDGYLDIAVSNCGGAAFLIRNEGSKKNNWIAIQAIGTKSNRFGFGARVRVETDRGSQTREISNVASYLSANDFRLYFGLGAEKVARKVEILWPSGRSQVLTDIRPNQLLKIEEPLL